MALLLVVAVPAALYVGLSLPAVQDYARNEAGRRLSDLLGADVEVGNLSITPFNKATLRNVSVTDQKATLWSRPDASGPDLASPICFFSIGSCSIM